MNVKGYGLLLALAACGTPKTGEKCEEHLSAVCDDDRQGFLLCEKHNGAQAWKHYGCAAGCTMAAHVFCDLSKNEPGDCAPTQAGWGQCFTASDNTPAFATCYALPNTPEGDDATAKLEWQSCSACTMATCTP